MRLRSFGTILLIFLFSGCQIPFYLEDRWGDDSIRGATALDKELMLRHASLRQAYKSGRLTESEGLYTHSNLKYVVQEEAGCFYLFFFGTDTIEDIYYDLIHWKEPFCAEADPAISVHAGFNRPYQERASHIKVEVQRYLETNPPEPKVYISGHSAGGVQAVLCAFDLAQDFTSTTLPVIHCQIGGSPAPGNKAFAEAVDREVQITLHRYRNGSDMMPGLLTEEMGFYHPGQPYHIGPEPDVLTAFTSLWLAWHFIEDYAASL